MVYSPQTQQKSNLSVPSFGNNRNFSSSAPNVSNTNLFNPSTSNNSANNNILSNMLTGMSLGNVNTNNNSPMMYGNGTNNLQSNMNLNANFIVTTNERGQQQILNFENTNDLPQSLYNTDPTEDIFQL